MQSTLEKFQTPSIDCYLILFLHSISPVKEDFANFNEIKALFRMQISDNIQHTNSINVDNKHFCNINQNLIFPLNSSSQNTQKSNFPLEIVLYNMLEKQTDNIIATSTLEIDLNQSQKFKQKKWICLHKQSTSQKIQTFLEISYYLINSNEIVDLPYKWNNIYKKELGTISATDIPGNFNLNFEEFQFSFYVAEQLKQEIIGYDFVIKYIDKEISSTIDNQNFSSVFKFPVITPFVNRQVEFCIRDKFGQTISTLKQDLTNYFIIETESDYAISFFHDEKKYFLGRFSFNFIKKQTSANRLGIFKQEELINSNREMYLLNQDEKEKFYLTFQIEFLYNFFDIDKDLILTIEWGQITKDIQINKNSGKLLIINEIVELAAYFYFINESVDFLPEVSLILKDQQLNILNYMYIQSAEIPFSSQCQFPMTFNNTMNSAIKDNPDISIQFKCNFHKPLNNEIQKQDLSKKICKYFLMDLIAIKGTNQQNQQLHLIHINKYYNYKFNSNDYFQWINKELIYQNEIYQNVEMPFQFCIQNSNKVFYSDYYFQDHLDGIPQWIQFNDHFSLLASIKSFENQNSLKKYLNIQDKYNQSLFKKINETDEVHVQDFQIELESRTIKFNFFKLQDIGQSINLLKLNNPALKVNLDSFIYDKKSYNKDQYRIVSPQIPQKYQNLNSENDTLYIQQEIELTLDLPKDKRLLQTVQLNLLQRDDDEDIELGDINLDLFDLYFTHYLNLYRKLRDLQEALESQNFKNKKEVMRVICEKMVNIEQNFVFVEEFQPFKKRNYLTFENMIDQQIQQKKQQNYFHKRKEELIEKANGLTQKQIMRFSNLPQKNSQVKNSQPLTNINDVVIYLEDRPQFRTNQPQDNYKLISQHLDKKAHLRFEEQKELEYSDFMFSDKQWSSFCLESDNSELQSQLQCTMDIFNDDDNQFFRSLDELGVDVSLLKYKNFKYKQYKPNQKIKMRLYLTELIFEQSKNECQFFEVYLDKTLIQKKTLQNKKEIRKRQKFIGLELNEKIKNCFTLGTYQTLKIVFYGQDKQHNKAAEEIGRTEIDLNRRLNCNIWRNLTQIPIEKRIISKKGSLVQLGYVKLWLEMFSKDQKVSFPEFEISPYSQQEQHEVRVVVWSIENLGESWGFKNKENFLRVSMNTEIFPYDIDESFSHKNQFTEPILIKNQQKLVTINHRFVWRFKLDGFRKNFNSLLNIKIANDSEKYEIDRKLDCTNQLEDVIKQKIGRKSIIDDKQELLCFSEENPNGVKILITLDILNEEDISRKPAGLGRNHPNANPYLPSPNENVIEEPNRFMGFSNKQIYWLIVAFFTCFVLTLICTFFLTRVLV